MAIDSKIPDAERITLVTNGPDDRLIVFIDQDCCTGDGLCEQIEDNIFHGGSDGFWYIQDADGNKLSEGVSGARYLPEAALETAVEAAEDCPGECIYIVPESLVIERSLLDGPIASA